MNFVSKIEEDWTPELFFDLIGSWGAFYSSLLLIFGTAALVYNEQKWNFLLEEVRTERDSKTN